MPKPTTNTVTLTSATSSLTPNVSTTPGISAVMTLLANATTKHVRETTMVQYHLYALLQFFGFSGSPGRKVTSLYRCSPSGSIGPGISPSRVSERYSSMLAAELNVR